MKLELKTRFIGVCSVYLVCFTLCGCYEEQSYFKNKNQYYISLEELKDDARRSMGEQDQIEYYAQMVDDALDYVQEHSTEQMKKHIARGELVLGMNQKEVIACLHTKDFRDGVPVTSKIYNSKYGKYETWIVGGSSGDTHSSYSPPKYALDFTCYILTGIHET